MRWLDELLRHRVVEHLQQMVVVALDVQNPAGLALQAELGPSQNFAELFESTVAPRHGDKGIRQLSHQRLALMHGFDDPQVGHFGMRHLFGDQRMRDDADDLAAGRTSRVRQYSHQSHVSAAVDNGDSTGNQATRQRSGNRSVSRTRTWARSAKHANAFDHRHFIHKSASRPAAASSSGDGSTTTDLDSCGSRLPGVHARAAYPAARRRSFPPRARSATHNVALYPTTTHNREPPLRRYAAPVSQMRCRRRP